MVAAKNAGFHTVPSPSSTSESNRKPSSHAPSKIDIESNSVPSPSSTSQSTTPGSSSFDYRTTKPITSSTFSHERVFPIIQTVKSEVERTLDTAFTFEALTNADLDWKYVKPLFQTLTSIEGGQGGNGEGRNKTPPYSLVYALLVARIHFFDKADDDLAYAGVNIARGDLCEILAIKTLSIYGRDSVPSSHLYVLTAPFNPFSGSTLSMFTTQTGPEALNEGMLEDLKQDGQEEATNALELSISSPQAKRFVKSPLVQHVVKAIYDGDVMYSLESNHSLISDHYKSQPVVEIYDPRSRPFLDHYRLKVPYVRKTLELLAFTSVFVLFMATEATYDITRINLIETLFIIYSIGFTLDEFASFYSNGFSTYFYDSFNFLDSLFCLIFWSYLVIRVTALKGWMGDDDDGLSQLSFDVLGLGGCVLAPRLMVSLIPDHVVVMALGRMARQFALFMVLAALTASGFLVTFYILARGTWSIRQISWLLLRIWLSGAFLGFDRAQEFHPFFGPVLMVAFAVLSQTLLLTILISLLSNTFAQVQTDASLEIANQLAVRTLERVKSDPLSEYATPVNIVAFGVLGMAKCVVSPRMLHKLHVFLARTLNFPVLLFLAIQVRFKYRRSSNPTITTTNVVVVGGGGGGGIPRTPIRAGFVVSGAEGGTTMMMKRGSSTGMRRRVYSNRERFDHFHPRGITETTTTTNQHHREGEEESTNHNNSNGSSRRSSFVHLTKQTAQQAISRLSQPVESLLSEGWEFYEGGGEAVRRVFEFEVEVEKVREELVGKGGGGGGGEKKKKEKEKGKKSMTSSSGFLEHFEKRTNKKQQQRKQKFLQPSTSSSSSSEDEQEGLSRRNKAIEDRLSRIEDGLEVLLREMVRNRRSIDGINDDEGSAGGGGGNGGGGGGGSLNG